MRALFIGAHADDVEISAGGTIQTLVAEGWDVWITTTKTPDPDRLGEAIRAAEILGAAYMPYAGSARELTSYWDGFTFDLIVTPPDTDSHPDHREAAELGIALARKNNVSLWVMNHAIPGGIYRMPSLNHFVTFDVEEILTKAEALSAYRSQVDTYGAWWWDAISARDRYYGLMAKRDDAVWAEGFRIVHS